MYLIDQVVGILNQQPFVIARLVDEHNEEFLREESGDNCYTDDLEMAKCYHSLDELPQLKNGEYVVRFLLDKDGWVERIIRDIELNTNNLSKGGMKMPKYRMKPVNAITFEELVDYGRNNGGNIVNGMPWSFHYQGYGVTHENDECYLIPTARGTLRFTPEDMLITSDDVEIYTCKIDIFEKTYDLVG